MIADRVVRAIQFAAAIVCLVCVLAICIAPLLDLPHTINRAYLLALLLLFGLFACPISSARLLRGCAKIRCWRSETIFRRISLPLVPLQAGCVLQC
jgi:uncharacterized membrane protein YbhN (UPF0104 family)